LRRHPSLLAGILSYKEYRQKAGFSLAPSRSLLFFGNGLNVNPVPVLSVGELDLPLGQGEQSVILADAYIFARVDGRPALSDEDVTGFHEFTVGPFCAKILGIAVATVS